MPDVKECLPITAAAARAGVPRTTMESAVSRGIVKHYVMADGETRVVRLVDVDRWVATDRKRGPKPKGAK